MPPFFFVVGRSKVGKTTVIEGLLGELKKRGYRLGVIKHSSHPFDFDRAGKDTARFAAAGAEAVAFSSPHMAAFLDFREGAGELARLLASFQGLDGVIVEGFHELAGPKVLVHRSPGPLVLPEGCFAVVSDARASCAVPCFSFAELPLLAELVREKFFKHGSR